MSVVRDNRNCDAMQRQWLTDISQELRSTVAPLRFGSAVAFVYNPLDYAWHAHAAYLDRYGQGRREVLLLGMNPGPWGMAQTGVPFGEVAAVRDWMGIEAAVGRPRREHPKKPVLGFACRRSEVSGARLWGWARQRFGTPRRFFKTFFVANYCPLMFLDAGGRNLTPDKLRGPAIDRLHRACDAALVELVRLLRPRIVVGVGAFAEARARIALQGLDLKIGRMPHPSPASPAANRGWARQAEQALAHLGIHLP